MGITTNTNSNNVCETSIYSRGHGTAVPLQSVAFFFQIGITYFNNLLSSFTLSSGHGSAVTLQSVTFFFQIAIKYSRRQKNITHSTISSPDTAAIPDANIAQCKTWDYSLLPLVFPLQ
ncbi:hypothetical protein NIES2100_71340 [Calothrix sp. NIES-2100]|nr:hypothetical protein NIES2100_71340 [Calothrix sp. NIES-2100]